MSSGLALEDLVLLVHAEQVLAALLRVRGQGPGLAGLGFLPDLGGRGLGPGEPLGRHVAGAVLVTAAEDQTIYPCFGDSKQATKLELATRA